MTKCEDQEWPKRLGQQHKSIQNVHTRLTTETNKKERKPKCRRFISLTPKTGIDNLRASRQCPSLGGRILSLLRRSSRSVRLKIHSHLPHFIANFNTSISNLFQCRPISLFPKTFLITVIITKITKAQLVDKLFLNLRDSIIININIQQIN